MTATISADPFEAPAQRVEIKRDRYGRPLIPHPITGKEQAWTRVTTLAKTLSDTYNLGQWSERMVAHGLGKREDLYGLACSLDPEEDKSKLQEVCDKAKNAAGADAGANHGTTMHSFTDRYDRSGKIPDNIPDHLKADFDAYVAGMKAAQLQVYNGHLEQQVITLEHGTSGMFDRLLIHIPTGRLVIGDLKTGKSPYYDEAAIQFSEYAHGHSIWDPATRTHSPMPEGVDQESALMLWLPAGQARLEIWEVDIAAGWEMAGVAVRVRNYRKRKDLARPFAPVVHAAGAGWADQISAASSRADLSRIWQAATAAGEWTADLATAGAARLVELKQLTT